MSTLDCLQDECLGLVLRCIFAAAEGRQLECPSQAQKEEEEKKDKQQRAARLVTWASLLLASKRLRKIALHPDFAVWYAHSHIVLKQCFDALVSRTFLTHTTYTHRKILTHQRFDAFATPPDTHIDEVYV